MNARSAIRPDAIWLRRIDSDGDGVYLVLRVRSGIRQFTEIDGMTGNSQTVFEYNEEEIRHLLPKEISTAIQVRDHIIRNRMAIEEMAIDIGRKRAAIVKIETGKKDRGSIRSLGIEECRRAVFEAQQTQPKVQR